MLESSHYLWDGQEKWGHKFHCKQIEGGQNFSAFGGGQNFSAQTFEGHPEGTKLYLGFAPLPPPPPVNNDHSLTPKSNFISRIPQLSFLKELFSEKMAT